MFNLSPHYTAVDNSTYQKRPQSYGVAVMSIRRSIVHMEQDLTHFMTGVYSCPSLG